MVERESSIVKEKVVENSTASDTVGADVNEEPGTTRVTLENFAMQKIYKNIQPKLGKQEEAIAT